MQAHKITARSGDGKGTGAGEEVKQGLFLDGVHVLGHQPAVGQGEESALPVLPHVAEAPFPGIDLAFMGAQVAVDLEVFLFFIKTGFLHIPSWH